MELLWIVCSPYDDWDCNCEQCRQEVGSGASLLCRWVESCDNVLRTLVNGCSSILDRPCRTPWFSVEEMLESLLEAQTGTKAAPMSRSTLGQWPAEASGCLIIAVEGAPPPEADLAACESPANQLAIGSVRLLQN